MIAVEDMSCAYLLFGVSSQRLTSKQWSETATEIKTPAGFLPAHAEFELFGEVIKGQSVSRCPNLRER